MTPGSAAAWIEKQKVLGVVAGAECPLDAAERRGLRPPEDGGFGTVGLWSEDDIAHGTPVGHETKISTDRTPSRTSG